MISLSARLPNIHRLRDRETDKGKDDSNSDRAPESCTSDALLFHLNPLLAVLQRQPWHTDKHVTTCDAETGSTAQVSVLTLGQGLRFFTSG